MFLFCNGLLLYIFENTFVYFRFIFFTFVCEIFLMI